MRYICVLLTAGLLACGGGGGGGGGNPGGPTNAEIAQAILDACGQTSLNQLLELLDAFEPLLNPGSTKVAPAYNVDGADPGSGVIVWQLDLDGDMAPDIGGQIGFQDAADQPTAPFDFSQLAPDLSNLATLLGGAPDGTQVVIQFNDAGGSLVSRSGQIDATYQGGAAGALTGGVALNDGNTSCGASFELDAVALAALAGAIPGAPFGGQVTNEDGTADGTFTFDSTNSVGVTVTVNGEASDFVVDLASGTVTPSR